MAERESFSSSLSSKTRDSIVRGALNLLLIWIRAPGVSLSWRDEEVSRARGVRGSSSLCERGNPLSVPSPP